MARLHACQSFCQNPPLTGIDKFDEAALKASINDNGTFYHTSAMSRTLTLAPILPFAYAELVAKYTNGDLQRATKLA